MSTITIGCLSSDTVEVEARGFFFQPNKRRLGNGKRAKRLAANVDLSLSSCNNHFYFGLFSVSAFVIVPFS